MAAWEIRRGHVLGEEGLCLRKIHQYEEGSTRKLFCFDANVRVFCDCPYTGLILISPLPGCVGGD